MKKIKGFIKKQIRLIMYTFAILTFTIVFSIFFTIYDADVFAATSAKGSTGNDLKLLAHIINGEARGEKYIGQVAVGAVVMNRVKHPEYPKTITGVIYQKGQFTAVVDGNINKPIKKDSTVYKAAREAMNGTDPTNGCIFYYNPSTARSKWIFSRPVIKKIGKHNFTK